MECKLHWYPMLFNYIVYLFVDLKTLGTLNFGGFQSNSIQTLNQYFYKYLKNLPKYFLKIA